MKRFLCFLFFLSISVDLNLLKTTAAENEAPLVIFNRLPKVGSSMMLHLMRKFSRKNGWNMHQDGVHSGIKARLNCLEEDKLANILCNLPTPTVYARHVAYVNLTRTNCSNQAVTYINMVRDPVERIISWFYYIRNPDVRRYAQELHPERSPSSKKWLDKDFEQCVMNEDPECQFKDYNSKYATGNLHSQITYFCGMDKRCSELNNAWAFERAKENIERDYSVVGVLEKLQDSLKAFEIKLPHIFAGAREIYANHEEQLSKVNRNPYKPKVSEEVKNIVRARIGKEMEFYECCKDRLRGQIL